MVLSSLLFLERHGKYHRSPCTVHTILTFGAFWIVSILDQDIGNMDCSIHFSSGPCTNPTETPQLLAIKVSWLKALLCSMSTVQSYLTSEAFLLALQPVYAVRMKRKDLKSAAPAQLNWVSQRVSYCKGTIKRRKSIWSKAFKIVTR